MTPNRSVQERNDLVLQHQNLIGWAWNKWRHHYPLNLLTFDEAASAGQVALLRAAELWCPEVGEFAAYAIPAIKREMMEDAFTLIRVLRFGRQRPVSFGDLLHDIESGEEWQPTDDAPSPDTVASHTDFACEVLRVLTGQMAEAMRLRLDGYTNSDIAKTWGCSRQFVGQVIDRARRRLLLGPGAGTDVRHTRKRRTKK